ncbi:hypothetical protein BWI93_14815 [Siphonobacter sp. BAB-5385]|nr:hypothetical protein BWI93_14815 [Siphonobacter sp. BAB-5385]
MRKPSNLSISYFASLKYQGIFRFQATTPAAVTPVKPNTIRVMYARMRRRHSLAERKRLEKWLLSRVKSKTIQLMVAIEKDTLSS